MNIPIPKEGRPKRILVVDDVPEILMFFKDVARRIREHHVDLVVEANAQRAIERIWTEKFDVVISDCRMREHDGVTVLTAAREANVHGIRVMMTGYNVVPATIDRVTEMKVDAYLRKPLAMQDAFLLLRALLSNDENALRECRQHARTVERIAELQGEPVRVQ